MFASFTEYCIQMYFAAVAEIVLDKSYSIQEDQPGQNAKFKFEFTEYVDVGVYKIIFVIFYRIIVI